ncbi:cell wall protein PRY3 [Nematostella vectensis]|uniref:cell wall protein PRY3 n=1 Tax=Nematostella vectensis TaxID=45351 RepID=UPI00207777A5|nr:cell wall protein PRY3 [Nematostella vectensis]
MKSLVLSVVLFVLGSCQDAFDKNCLEAHNEYRKRHGAKEMTWSASLATDAQKWADKLSQTDAFKHDYASINSKSQGENLAYFTPQKPKCMGPKAQDCVTCAEIVKDWYDEVQFYDFNTGKEKQPGSVITHFTQVVWDASTELGVGVGINKSPSAKYGFITVARYFKRGNFGNADEFKKNVFPEVAPGATTVAPGTTTAASSGSGSTTGSPSQPTTLPVVPTLPATGGGNSGSGKNGSDNCEYFIVSSIKQEHKIIQKCKGKPNITFVPLPLPGNNVPAILPPAPTAKTTQGPSGASTQGATPTTGGPSGPTGGASSATPSATIASTAPPTTPSTTTLAPTTPLSEKEAKKQEAQATVLTNLYRTMHQVGQIEFDKDLSDAARAWAQKLAQDDDKLTHEPGVKEGENVASVPSSNTAIMDAFDAWYDESSKYDYANAKFSKETGHFTQLVWKATQKMGIGTAKNAKGDKEYVVARFSPAGNIKGQFADNVLPSIVNK